jgi:hypothetical protein
MRSVVAVPQLPSRTVHAPTTESARSGPQRVLAGIRSLMAEAQPGSDVPRRSPGAAEGRAPSSRFRVISRPTDGID